LGNFINNEEPCKVFVRDLFPDENSKLISVEPRKGTGYVPNIPVVWPEVEGITLSYILNVLGNAGKTKNIEVVKMSQDKGEWNSNIIVIGAQAQKSFDFYSIMKNVAYSIDRTTIRDANGREIEMETGYRYGLVLKVTNPLKKGGHAFLIGGLGVTGTLAAAYYFRNNFKQLGNTFKNRPFGIVVRCSTTAGEESTERIQSLDKRFN
jgi:hypothetical protein